MYARVVWGRFKADTADEIQRLVDEALVPKLKQLPGFQSYRGGFNRSAGTLIALSFWDTEEHAQALQAQRGPFEAMGVTQKPQDSLFWQTMRGILTLADCLSLSKGTDHV